MARSVLQGGGTTAPASPVGTQQGVRTGGRGKGIRLGGAAHADAFYLWVLLGLELTATVILRNWSRNHHGG